jgi:hypothetical protein
MVAAALAEGSRGSLSQFLGSRKYLLVLWLFPFVLSSASGQLLSPRFGCVENTFSTACEVPLLVVRGWFKPQAWFCGECNKIFYPAHWLVQADTSRFPSYVAQCPECKGGNTQLCLQEREIQYEEAEAKCNVCGAPPLSVACHRYQGKERGKERE